MNGVRFDPHGIPLVPCLDNITLAVDNHDAMRPTRIHAAYIARPFPLRPTVFIVVIGTGLGCVPPGHRVISPRVVAAYRKTQAGSLIFDQAALGTVDLLQHASLNDEDPVRTLRENALDGTPRPTLVPGQRRDVLWPIRIWFVRSKRVLATLSGTGILSERRVTSDQKSDRYDRRNCNAS